MLGLKQLPIIDASLPTFIAREKWEPKYNVRYVYEPKYDGFRCILYWHKTDGIIFSSRSEKVHTNIPRPFMIAIHKAIASTGLTNCILDGELIAIDKDHLAGNFGNLALRKKGTAILQLRVFDIVFANDLDLRKYRWFQRRKLLEQKFKFDDLSLKLSAVKDTLEEAEKLYTNVEGVVVKAYHSPYIGKRTTSWLKIKNVEGKDFVVLGYEPGTDEGNCEDTFGSLRLFEKIEVDYGATNLVYVGNVGSGFSFQEREAIWDWINRYCTDRWRAFEVEVHFARRTTDKMLWHPRFIKVKFPGE